MSTNSILIQRLFNAGAHFGFKKSRRHPTVVPYLFTTKEGVDIFDLEKTAATVAEVDFASMQLVSGGIKANSKPLLSIPQAGQ